jgi:hypothetical protein
VEPGAGPASLAGGDPWRLYVNTPYGLSFDRMVYVPSGRYPTTGWGGAVVPIGRSAYVWE